MSLVRYKFGELFRFLPKSKIQAGKGESVGQYKFFTSSSAQKKWINEALYDLEGLIFGTGGSASVHYAYEKFSTSTDCFVAELVKKNEVSTRFVYHFLKFNIDLLERGFKGAGLKHISKHYIEDIQIPLPPLEEQKRIAAIIDEANEVKRKRELAIDKLDDLVKSVFHDTFVSLHINKSVWDESTIEFCANDEKGAVRTGPFGSDLLHSEFTNKGVAVLGIDNAVNNYFSWSKLRYINLEKYEQLKRYTVKPSDVLITIMGTCGKCAVVPEDIGPAINTKHLCCITLNQEKCLPTFLHSYFLMHPVARQYLLQTAKGAIMNGLNMRIIKDMPILLPPIFLQTQYDCFTKKIQIEKLKQNNSLLAHIDLLNSIQHQAFTTGFTS